MEEKLKYEEEKNKRKNFIDEIKLTLEAEYNAPLKPESVEQVDRSLIKEKFKKCMEVFQSKNNMKQEEIIQMLLDNINERRNINPATKEEHNVLEEILYDILEEGKER